MNDLFGRVPLMDTGERQDLDYYPTPSWMTRSLLHFHPAIAGATVLEPCAGDDAITRVLREEFGCEVFTNDLDPRHPAMTHEDACSTAYWRTAPPVRWIVSNFPFNLAMEILPHAFAHAEDGVALLFRKTFLEPTDDRGPWLQDHPPTRLIGEPRYDFRRNGKTDSVSCDWCVWEKDAKLPRLIYRPPFVIDYAAERRVR